MRGKRYIAEVLVLRLSHYRYLVIGEEKEKIMKHLKRARRKFRSSVISDCTQEYALLSMGTRPKNSSAISITAISTGQKGKTTLISNRSRQKHENSVMEHFPP